MIRFLFRFIGLWFLAAGFIFLIYDGMKSIADQRIFITTTRGVWTAIHQNSLGSVEAWVAAHAPAWAMRGLNLAILEQPTWLVLGVVGIVLILLGRRKKPLIGYAR
jgi:hypothetical protein